MDRYRDRLRAAALRPLLPDPRSARDHGRNSDPGKRPVQRSTRADRTAPRRRHLRPQLRAERCSQRWRSDRDLPAPAPRAEGSAPAARRLLIGARRCRTGYFSALVAAAVDDRLRALHFGRTLFIIHQLATAVRIGANQLDPGAERLHVSTRPLAIFGLPGRLGLLLGQFLFRFHALLLALAKF